MLSVRRSRDAAEKFPIIQLTGPERNTFARARRNFGYAPNGPDSSTAFAVISATYDDVESGVGRSGKAGRRTVRPDTNGPQTARCVPYGISEVSDDRDP